MIVNVNDVGTYYYLLNTYQYRLGEIEFGNKVHATETLPDFVGDYSDGEKMYYIFGFTDPKKKYQVNLNNLKAGTEIDLFLVGGGGGGASTYNQELYERIHLGGAGGDVKCYSTSLTGDDKIDPSKFLDIFNIQVGRGGGDGSNPPNPVRNKGGPSAFSANDPTKAILYTANGGDAAVNTEGEGKDGKQCNAKLAIIGNLLLTDLSMGYLDDNNVFTKIKNDDKSNPQKIKKFGDFYWGGGGGSTYFAKDTTYTGKDLTTSKFTGKGGKGGGGGVGAGWAWDRYNNQGSNKFSVGGTEFFAFKLDEHNKYVLLNDKAQHTIVDGVENNNGGVNPDYVNGNKFVVNSGGGGGGGTRSPGAGSDGIVVLGFSIPLPVGSAPYQDLNNAGNGLAAVNSVAFSPSLIYKQIKSQNDVLSQNIKHLTEMYSTDDAQTNNIDEKYQTLKTVNFYLFIIYFCFLGILLFFLFRTVKIGTFVKILIALCFGAYPFVAYYIENSIYVGIMNLYTL